MTATDATPIGMPQPWPASPGAVRAILRASRRRDRTITGHAEALAALDRTLAQVLGALREHAHGPQNLVEAIGADFAAGSREREVLSAIHHRYFGPRMSVSDLARNAGVHRRTIQRRLAEGYVRLAMWSDVTTPRPDERAR